MRIKNIELHNFGSYGGHNSFNFESDIPEERVVVIGGKNGTGKTTLFTAIQVCLYGNFAFGFKTAGKRYLNCCRMLCGDHRHQQQKTGEGLL